MQCGDSALKQNYGGYEVIWGLADGWQAPYTAGNDYLLCDELFHEVPTRQTQHRIFHQLF